MNRYRYLSPEMVAAYEKKKKTQIIVGSIIMGLSFIGIIMGLIEKDPMYFTVYGPGFIAGSIVLLLGLLKARYVTLSRRYETIFSCDNNGTITIDELVLQTGKDKKQIVRELEKLFGLGFFTDCTFQRGGQPCVIISSAMVDEKGKGFAEVICDQCGGSTRIRSGSRGQCQFCGAPISDDIRRY